MLTIETTGAPFDRGVQQGKACRELVRAWFERTLRRLAGEAQVGSTEELVRLRGRQVARWRGHAEAVYPEAIEESCGIAAGLGLSEDSYFTVAFCGLVIGSVQQCTTLGFRDAHGQPLLGKTDDLFEPELGVNVLETTLPHRGYRHMHFHFAGSVWTVSGMNERGLAIAMTGIPGPTLDEPGASELVALHAILPACATVPEAIELIRKLRVNCYGFSLLLGDAAGGLALVEKNGFGTAVLPEQPGGLLLHTNHILDAELARRSPQQVPVLLANGTRRYENARRMLPSLPRSEEGMKRLYSDRGPHGAIWQKGEDGFFTDFVILLLPAERTFHYWTAPPGASAAAVVEMSKVFE